MSKNKMDFSFPYLGALSVTLRVLGWAKLVIGGAIAIAMIFAPMWIGRFWPGMVISYQLSFVIALAIGLLSAFACLLLLAWSDYTYLMVSMEDNTRHLRKLLDKK